MGCTVGSVDMVVFDFSVEFWPREGGLEMGPGEVEVKIGGRIRASPGKSPWVDLPGGEWGRGSQGRGLDRGFPPGEVPGSVCPGMEMDRRGTGTTRDPSWTYPGMGLTRGWKPQTRTSGSGASRGQTLFSGISMFVTWRVKVHALEKIVYFHENQSNCRQYNAVEIKNNNQINSNLFERSTPPIGISLSSSLIPLLPGCGKAMYLGITGGLGDLQKTNKYPAIGVTQG